MERISNNKLKALEIDILLYIDKLCKQNNLRYFLAGGTLLGAIRHLGFIPWDDDIDISMPREDYERLIEIVNKHSNSYHCISYLNGYMLSFAKIINTKTIFMDDSEKYQIKDEGIFIDIFPIDGLGNKKLFAKIRLKLYRKIFSNIFKTTMYREFFKVPCNSSNSIIRAIQVIQNYFILHIKTEAWIKIFNDINKKSFEHSIWIASSTGMAGMRELIKQECFQKSCFVEFEGYEFPAPIGWDTYLKNLYGDYSKLPPEDQRKRNHSIKAYWKEN